MEHTENTYTKLILRRGDATTPHMNARKRFKPFMAITKSVTPCILDIDKQNWGF